MSAGTKVAIIVGIGAGAAAGAFLATQSQRANLRDGPSAIAVVGRLFDSTANPVGDPSEISTDPSADQHEPALASDPAGNFVVAWTSESGDGAASSVRARRFDNAGNPLGPDFPVNTYTTGRQFEPDVGMSDGGFVVVWSSDGGQDGSGAGVFGRRFDSSGNPAGGEFQVHTSTAGDQNAPSAAMNAAGFVVVWQSAESGGAGSGVFGQRYDAAGNPSGGEFPIPAHTAGDQGAPDVAIGPTGGFVAVWQSAEQDGSSTGIAGRLFAADGEPIGVELVVNASTSGAQSRPRVAIDPSGQFVATWESDGQDDPGAPDGAGIFAQRFSASGRRLEAELLVNVHTTGDQRAPDVAIDERGQFFVSWESDGQASLGTDAYLRRAGFPEGEPLDVDARASGGSSDVNGVLEPEERVTVDPGWRNRGPSPLLLTGSASNFTGPAGPAYTLHDGASDYGSIAVGEANGCFGATTDCLELAVAGSRPSLHWDATFDEDLSEGVTKTWTLHVGDSFGDVPRTNVFYGFIESLLHNGVTAGGACGGYCPNDGVKRQQMAVFLLRARFGTAFPPPPATGAVFLDVPASSPFAPWIEHLASLGITGGCAPGLFCPEAIVNRQQMAVFLLKTFEGSEYVPPAATGIFLDLPPANPFAPWAEELYARQVTGGCVANPLQYCPLSQTNRQQMAAFLTKTFGLQLYGP